MKRRGFFKALGSISLGIMLATPFDILTKEKEKLTAQIVVTGRNQFGEISKECYEIELPYTEKQLQTRLYGDIEESCGLERVREIYIENPQQQTHRRIRLF